jgi:6-phosphofructokinase
LKKRPYFFSLAFLFLPPSGLPCFIYVKPFVTFFRTPSPNTNNTTDANPQGTSRGNAKIKDIVNRLRLWNITMLFVIGGNGGNAAAHAIAQECEAQGLVCNVIGVPKSIDNDILLIDRCFGFDTAVEESQRALVSARVEARSAGGVTVVKLMGRQSGFISMNASMASGVVDVVGVGGTSFLFLFLGLALLSS